MESFSEKLKNNRKFIWGLLAAGIAGGIAYFLFCDDVEESKNLINNNNSSMAQIQENDNLINNSS